MEKYHIYPTYDNGLHPEMTMPFDEDPYSDGLLPFLKRLFHIWPALRYMSFRIEHGEDPVIYCEYLAEGHEIYIQRTRISHQEVDDL